MSTLLITGGAGFIGSNFAHFWARRHPADEIVILDALTYAGNRASLAPLLDRPRFQFVHGDIADEGLVCSLLEQHRIDTVVHFAAESHVDRSIAGPEGFIRTNVVGTHVLLQATRKLWIESRLLEGRRGHFHHVSTDEVYGSLGETDPPFNERTAFAPNSPYAASKAASDHLVRAYRQTYQLPVTVTNCSNNFGPYHFPEKLIPLATVNMLEGRPVPVYGDGQHVRDWLYVSDHCRAIELVLRNGPTGETYNVGGENGVANLDVVRTIAAEVDRAFREDPGLCDRFPAAPAASGARSSDLITFVADRPGHDRRYAIDASKIRRALGFETEVSFAAGIALTVRWYLENESWWRAVMNGSYRSWIAQNYGGR